MLQTTSQPVVHKIGGKNTVILACFVGVGTALATAEPLWHALTEDNAEMAEHDKQLALSELKEQQDQKKGNDLYTKQDTAFHTNSLTLLKGQNITFDQQRTIIEKDYNHVHPAIQYMETGAFASGEAIIGVAATLATMYGIHKVQNGLQKLRMK